MNAEPRFVRTYQPSRLEGAALAGTTQMPVRVAWKRLKFSPHHDEIQFGRNRFD